MQGIGCEIPAARQLAYFYFVLAFAALGVDIFHTQNFLLDLFTGHKHHVYSGRAAPRNCHQAAVALYLYTRYR